MSRTRPPVETATERLTRLLALVPWLNERQGIEVDEAARQLGITPEQLQDDLDLVLMCGYGTMPDEMIDVAYESGRIVIHNADTIARPLRIGHDEALALLLGLESLATVPGATDLDALESVRAKLEAATTAGDGARAEIAVARDARTDVDATLTALRDALDRHRRVRLVYLVASRDDETQREVDPMRLVTAPDGTVYLEAWCHRAEGVRTFRVSRIRSATVLDVDGTPPADARPNVLDEHAFAPGEDDPTAVLELEPTGRWVAEYVPVESVEELGEGRLRVRLRVSSEDWLVRLALRLGGSGRVLEPRGLADRVAEAARAGLVGYGEDPAYDAPDSGRPHAAGHDRS